MRQYYKILMLLLSGICCVVNVLSQDVGYSQFYDQPILRNPALAGVFTGDARITASYRNQWQSVTIPYRTFGLSAEFKMPLNLVENDNLTLGLQLIRDIAGTSQFSTLQIMPVANYSFPMSENSYLSVAFMGGLMQQRFDPSKLVLNDQFVAGSNGSFSILPASGQVWENTSANYLDVSAGVSYSGMIGKSDYFIGAGMFHATRPKVGFFEGSKITLNKKVAFNGGVSIPVAEIHRVILYADLFKQFGKGFQPAGSSTIQFGSIFDVGIEADEEKRNSVAIGLLYRLNDALIPVVQLRLDKFTVSASYDVNISSLNEASQKRGGLEMVFTYRGKLKKFDWPCPRFSY